MLLGLEQSKNSKNINVILILFQAEALKFVILLQTNISGGNGHQKQSWINSVIQEKLSSEVIL